MSKEKITGTAFLFMLLTLNCFYSKGQSNLRVKYDTINKLTDLKKKVGYLKFGEKRYYKFERVPASQISFGEQETEKQEGVVFYPGAVKCSGDKYAGIERAMAKTHPATGKSVTVETLDQLLDLPGLVAPDNKMKNHHPKITEGPTSARVKEENINVKITRVWLYGIYREEDNDFHLIIGNGKQGSKMVILNAEISGLPAEGKDLAAVREKIISVFGNLSCGTGAYRPVDNLIPITIQGSLLFDMDHPGGKAGFGVYKPRTAWEIHPVINIEFPSE